ncbi:MAG: nucleotide exchange factor GrpE [Planctomycetota bacterium]|jgi:hypothetical protein
MVGVALVGGILIGVLCLYVFVHKPALERVGRVSPATEETPPERRYPYDVETRGALRLPPFDPATNLHADKPAAYRKRRDPQRLETEYRIERKRRVAKARGIADLVSERLELTRDQGNAVFQLIMERGDTARIAAYRNLAGVLSQQDKHQIQDDVKRAFRAKLQQTLTDEQYLGYRRIEESDEKGQPDIGFGAAYGVGGGKDRAFEKPPRSDR